MKRNSSEMVMNLKFNLHKKNVAKASTELPDIESFQKNLLESNAKKIELVMETQKLADEISCAISTEFLQAKYEETPLINRLKEFERAVLKASTYEEILEIRTQFSTLMQAVREEKMLSALKQQGINASVGMIKKSE